MNIIKIITAYLPKMKKNINTKKQELRDLVSERKKKLSEAEKISAGQKVFEKIEKLTEFKMANTILLYWSMSDELPTHSFIVKWSKDKKILLPIVKGDVMLIKPFSSENALKKSSYGIWEPDVQREFASTIDMVIAPGVAFDRDRNRLGRGKGYYDKYFTDMSVTKIGVGFDQQLFDKIPWDEYDVRLDKVITPSATIE